MLHALVSLFCFVLLPSCTDVMAEHFLKCISWKKLWRNIHMNLWIWKFQKNAEVAWWRMKNVFHPCAIKGWANFLFVVVILNFHRDFMHLNSHPQFFCSNNTSHQSILAWYAPWRPVTFMNHQGNFEANQANPLPSCWVNNESSLFVASQL